MVCSKFGGIRGGDRSTRFALEPRSIPASALRVMGRRGKLTDLLGASARDQRGQTSPI